MKLWIAGFTLCTAAYAQAESANLKVVEKSGHLSPVAITVTSMNGQTRNLVLVGIGRSIHNDYLTHQLTVRTDGGASNRNLWLDSIRAIRGTSNLRRLNDEFTIVLKDGKEIQAMFANWHDYGGCSGEPSDGRFDCSVLFARNEDDGIEKIELRKVKAVDFIGPVRKDKAGNAMYDLWRYSPFTGEKLP
jgi:hypothetical protein